MHKFGKSLQVRMMEGSFPQTFDRVLNVYAKLKIIEWNTSIGVDAILQSTKSR